MCQLTPLTPCGGFGVCYDEFRDETHFMEIDVIHAVFAIRDTKAEAFLPPFCSPNTSVALRSLSDLMRDPNHAFSQHDMDYTLYRLGDFDDVAGRYNVEAAPIEICRLTELKGPQ